jgi:hypothetical protein
MELTEKETVDMGNAIKEEVFKDQPEKQELTPEQAIEEYLNSNDTKLNAIYWASKFDERFNGNWFTVEQVQKKTTFKTFKDAIGVLQVMCLVGVCHSSGQDGKTKYKVTLDLDQKVLLMKKEKERMEKEKEQALKNITFEFDMRISALDSQIEKMGKVEVVEQ